MIGFFFLHLITLFTENPFPFRFSASLGPLPLISPAFTLDSAAEAWIIDVTLRGKSMQPDSCLCCFLCTKIVYLFTHCPYLSKKASQSLHLDTTIVYPKKEVSTAGPYGSVVFQSESGNIENCICLWSMCTHKRMSYSIQEVSWPLSLNSFFFCRSFAFMLFSIGGGCCKLDNTSQL